MVESRMCILYHVAHVLQFQNSIWRFRYFVVSVCAVILGNAYVFLFFTCGQNPQLSQQALSAYAQSVSIHHLFLESKCSEPFAPLRCCLLLTLHAPWHAGKSGQISHMLPRPSLQPVHPVPVRGDVRCSVGGLQSGCSSQPRLGWARQQGKAATRLLEEGHWSHGKQGVDAWLPSELYKCLSTMTCFQSKCKKSSWFTII